MTKGEVSRDDAGAYALNALEPHEHAAYEQLLVTSDHARREAEEFATAATYLAAFVKPISPTPLVKHTLMEKITAIPMNSGAGASSERKTFDDTNTLPLTLPVTQVPPKPDALTSTSETLA